MKNIFLGLLAAVTMIRADVAAADVFMTVSSAGTVAGEAGVPVSDSKFLELSVVPATEDFKVGEKIVFEVVLTNAGKVALKVMPLNEKSMSCSINGYSWGVKTAEEKDGAILMPGEKVRKKFKVSGAGKPGPFKVQCAYGMAVNGVYPATEKIFNIVK